MVEFKSGASAAIVLIILGGSTPTSYSLVISGKDFLNIVGRELFNLVRGASASIVLRGTTCASSVVLI